MRASIPKAAPPALALALVVLTVSPGAAVKLNGTVEVGGITLDQSDGGDRSTVQETYNIYKGFDLSRILLDGRFDPRRAFTLDLREINQDSRQGLLSWRMADLGDVTARYVQHRQIFDPDAAVSTHRKDLTLGARVAPARWLRLTADYDHQTRDGDRLPLLPIVGADGGHLVVSPDSLATFLGSTYDYTLHTGRFEAEGHYGGRSVALSYDLTRFADDAHAGADRHGDVVALRIYGADPFFPGTVTHYLRGALGRHEVTGSDLRWKIAALQYDGIVRPQRQVEFKYDLWATRVDDNSTRLKTDDIRNSLDLTWFCRHGRLFGGYSYVTRDDDRTLTSTNAWRAGAAYAHRDLLRADVSYASSDKKDQEELTLLKNVEQSRWRARLWTQPRHAVTVGGSFADRVREFPVLSARTEGWRLTGFGRVAVTAWGSVSAEYSYSREKYDDTLGAFNTSSNIVTGRVEVGRIRDLTLAAAVTYLDIGRDLDIEKSILSFEARYALRKDYHVSVRYNVYNYDDYVLLDRYYTANVVWFNVGYDFSLD
jgi:hypothetical protein